MKLAGLIIGVSYTWWKRAGLKIEDRTCRIFVLVHALLSVILFVLDSSCEHSEFKFRHKSWKQVEKISCNYFHNFHKYKRCLLEITKIDENFTLAWDIGIFCLKRKYMYAALKNFSVHVSRLIWFVLCLKPAPFAYEALSLPANVLAYLLHI